MRLLHDKRVKRRNDVIYVIILRFAHGFGERFVAVELGTHEQTADQLPVKITIKVASSDIRLISAHRRCRSRWHIIEIEQ